MSRPKNSRVPLDLRSAPTPLACVLRKFHEEPDRDAFRKVHRLVDAIEVLVKLHTAILVSHYTGHAKLSPKIRTLLAAGLKTPSLGIWWQFARDVAGALEEERVPPLLPGMDAYVLRGPLKKALDGENSLITFRNLYAHGATPKNEKCAADVAREWPRFESLVAEARHLARGRLVTVLSDGRALEGTGVEPRPIEAPKGAEPGKCYFMGPGEDLLLLDPLLVYREDSKAFFFYNDLREKAVALLNYDECLRLRDEALRAFFLSRFPIHEWKERVPEAEEFLPRIEALTEVFKGRRKDLGRIFEFLAKDSGFLMVWGSPGVGKSALLARVVQVLGWPAGLRAEIYPELSELENRYTVVPYFIRRDEGTDRADRLLNNLNRRLEARFRTGIGLAGSVPNQADWLKKRLEAISAKLGESERLLLVIDGLDEGSDAEALLENLPRSVPGRVLALYASRENPRVFEVVYENLDRERHASTSLEGLLEEDVRALLHEHVDKYALEEEYVDEVLKRSAGNPLYLKLLCEGLSVGDYRLNDRVRLPEKMEEIYDRIYRRLAQVDGVPDLLALLVAARDYVSPAMAASLLGRSESDVRTRIIHACLEILHENPLTEALDDYQLFHESLREYLREKYASDVVRWDERLADWCLAWSELKGELPGYALRYAVPHLVSSYRRATDDKDRSRDDEGRASGRYEQMIALVDNEEYRAAVFRICGNAAPLQAALVSVQRLLLERGGGAPSLSRIVSYALAFHEEGIHRYREQLVAIDRCGEAGGKMELEEIPEFALMGESPRDRVLLVLRALWQRRHTPRLPEMLTGKVESWLREASDPALEQLWEETVRR